MSSNCRRISLMSVPGKVFGHIVLERMRSGVEKKLCKNKKIGRSCTDKIFCLWILMEKLISNFKFQHFLSSRTSRPPLTVSIVPQCGTYSPYYGIPFNFMRIILCVYENCEAAVVVEGEITDWLRIETLRNPPGIVSGHHYSLENVSPGTYRLRKTQIL